MRFLFAAQARGDLPKGTAQTWIEHTDTPIKQLPERVSSGKKAPKKAPTNVVGDELGIPTKQAVLSSGSTLSTSKSLLNPIPPLPQPKPQAQRIQAAAQRIGQTNMQQAGPPTTSTPGGWMPGANGQTLYPAGQGPVSGQVPKTASLGTKAAALYLAKKERTIAQP